MKPIVAEVAAMWADFAAATGASEPYSAWGFADDAKPDLMTKLGLLVRDGPKRATAGREDDFTDEEPIPSSGDHHVIVDGEGHPLCIIRTTSVEVRPFGQVDAQLAWDEGEGDRSLQWWRDAHIRYFASVRTRSTCHERGPGALRQGLAAAGRRLTTTRAGPSPRS